MVDSLDKDRKELMSLKSAEEARNYKNIYLRYYKGLLYLKTKHKFSDNGDDSINLRFSWNDSITGEKYISKGGIDLEICSILYNLAAIIGNTGALNTPSKSTLRDMSHDFKNSAWLFNQLLEKADSLPSDQRGFDFSSANLKRHALLQLAQAQYCTFKLAEIKEAKTKFIASLAKRT